MLQAARYLLGSPGATGFGSKSTAEDVTAACPDLAALTAIITGATSGIGAETARVLAKRGARVVIPARSVKAAEDMRARILAECPAADVLVLPLDLSSLASVRAFADRFLALGLPLHLLINNAGKFSHGQLALSEDGVEMTFATNYLASAGSHGGDGGGDGRAGPHRERVVQRARLVRRRLGRVPPPRHPPQDTLRRDAGVRGVEARQRAAHPGARRAAAGNGRQRDGELRPPGHRQDPPQPRPRRRPHRCGVLAAVQAAENDPSGCGDHVLRGGPPEGGRRVRPLLRRLQRGAAVAGRHQPPRRRAPLAHLRGHDRLPAAARLQRPALALAPGAGRSIVVAASNLIAWACQRLCLPLHACTISLIQIFPSTVALV